MNQVHFSSGKDDWETPDELFTRYDARFHFILDAAANAGNHKCPRWFGPGGEADSALDIEWPLEDGNIWMNPPYSRGLQSQFVEKASDQAHWHHERGGKHVVVCLLPARTDTRLFHDEIWHRGGPEVEFLKGRVKFKGAPHGAPFPSMIVIF